MSDAVLTIAQGLVEVLSDQAHLLVGIVLDDPTSGQRVTLDLAVMTKVAMFVGIDGHRESVHNVSPRVAACLLADLVQREWVIAQPIPIYAFWLGDAVPESRADGSPELPDADKVCRYIRRAATGEVLLSEDQVAALAEKVLRRDLDLQGRRRSPASHLRHAIRGLADLPRRIDAGLQEQIRQPFLSRRSGPVLPADVNRCLEKAMLARENVLEGADYAKIVPNDYLVELNEDNYRRNYEPIEQEVCVRWEARLLDVLNTTNSRWGHKAYRLGGRVRVRIDPVLDLAEGEVRVRCQVISDVGTMLAAPTRAYIELVPGGHEWLLREETVTIGRDESCAICLDMPAVQSARLVSSQHAHIAHREGNYIVFDGTPEGKPSTNGTFVNGQRVGKDGRKLDDGDAITLASPDPNLALSDGLGAVALCFHLRRMRDP
jgi:hypothetical protein